MTDTAVYILAAVGAVLVPIVGFLYLRVRALEKSQVSNHEVKYFEYVEDSSGALKNSRKYVVKGQIYFHGLPIGSPFVVSEHVIEEFSWEKFAKIRSEILLPMLNFGVDVGLAFKGAGGAAKGVIDAAVKGMKSKAS